MQRINRAPTDRYGNVLFPGTVTVYVAGTLTKAALFGNNGVTPLDNPVSYASDQGVAFYVASGRYDLKVNVTGYTDAVEHDVIVFDPSEEGASVVIAALGYTPENVANKDTNPALGISDTTYPSQHAVRQAIDTGDATTLASAESYTDAAQAGAEAYTDSHLLNYVPKTTTVNTHALSGNITLTAADVGAPAGSGTSTGTNTGDQIITLTGDVTGSGTGSFVATVASVDGSTAANVHSAELAANAATSANTASTIVKRDASGNFNAGTVTAALTGNASTATALATARNIDGQGFDGTANITVIAPGTHTAASKATPVDSDELPLVDSAASDVLKKLTWANLKATAKTYLDGFYQTLANLATSTSLGSSDTLYPSQNAVKVYVDAGDAATLASAHTYTDTQIAALDAKEPVAYCSTSNLTANYANGSSGVGATLTSTTNGPLIIDGITTVLGAQGVKILVAGQSTDFQNGWYTLSQQGIALVQPWILTRDTLSDQAAEIESGYLTAVKAPSGLTPGGSNDQKIFISIAPSPFTVGSSSLTFGLVGGTYAAGTGITLSGVTFSLTAPVTVALGGTNSTTALNSNRMMVSVGGAIIERAAQTVSSPLRTDGSGLPTTGLTSLTNEVSGTLQAAQMPAFTGDVTTAGATLTTVLANVPSGTPHAGSSLITAISAPSTPASGKASAYVDSTSKALAVKNDAGTVSHTVQTKAAASNQFLTAIADDGTVSAAQPTEANLSFSDITTNDVSTTKHGFAPKGPNDVTKFLDGTGSYSVPAGTGAATSVPVRQTVLTAPTTSGLPTFLAAGTGLAADLVNNSSTAPVVIAFANGYGSTGAVDSVASLTATAAGILTLPASNLSFITADYVSSSSVTWGQTLCPPQDGITYDRTKQALLHFDGTNAATTFLDDYGNTWTANGNAQLDTSQKKFGSASLKLDGTGDSASSSSFTKLGDESWTLECWVRFNALPGSGTTMGIFSAKTSAGMVLGINNTSGTYKLNLWLSSNDSSFDISNGTAGAALTTPVINTWYHVMLTYDNVAGKYFAQFDGSATGSISVTSTTRVAAITSINFGAASNGVTNDLNGWIDEARFSPCCRYSNGSAFTPSASAFDPTVVGQSSDWLDMSIMQLKVVSTASASAGTDPTFTATKRVYVGEAKTTATAFATSHPINYALRGRFESGISANINTSVITSYSHNLGIRPRRVSLRIVCSKADNNWLAGDEIEIYPNYSGPIVAVGSDRTTGTQNMNSTALEIMNKTSAGTAVAATVGSWGWRAVFERGW